MTAAQRSQERRWPELPWHDWEPTLSTVHRWLQIVGRVRMVVVPKQPHWGHVPLLVTDRGLSTGALPHPTGTFRIDLDFVDHRLTVARGRHRVFAMGLEPMAVARFYSTLLRALAALGIDVSISTIPSELADSTPFDQDKTHRSYVPEHAATMWRGFAEADRLLRTFRRSSRGWTEPGLFWGSLDLAIRRFTTDPAFEQSCGWWPTSETLGPAFYAYTTPQPPGYRSARFPLGGDFDDTLGEFILRWDEARSTAHPDAATTAFLRETARVGRPTAG